MPNFRNTTISNPSFCINKGTSYIVDASMDSITASISTLQNRATYLLISVFKGCSVLHTKMSGCIPDSNKVFTEC